MQCVVEHFQRVESPGEPFIFAGLLPKEAAWFDDQDIVLADYSGSILARHERLLPKGRPSFCIQSHYNHRWHCLVFLNLVFDSPDSGTLRLVVIHGSGDLSRVVIAPSVPRESIISPDGNRFCSVTPSGSNTLQLSRGWIDVFRVTFCPEQSVDIQTTNIFDHYRELHIFNDGRVLVSSSYDSWILWNIDGSLQRGSIRDGTSWFANEGRLVFHVHEEPLESNQYRLRGTRTKDGFEIGEWRVNSPEMPVCMNFHTREIGFVHDSECAPQDPAWSYELFGFSMENRLVQRKFVRANDRHQLGIFSARIVRAIDSLRNLVLAKLVSDLECNTTFPNSDAYVQFRDNLPDDTCRAIALGFYDCRLRIEKFTSIHEKL